MDTQNSNLMGCLMALPTSCQEATVLNIAMQMTDAAGVETLLKKRVFKWIILGSGIFFVRMAGDRLLALYKVKNEDKRAVYDRLYNITGE